MADKPIFFDATGRRARRITIIGWALAVLGLVLFVGFATSVVLSPPVTSLDLPVKTVAVNPSNLVRRAQKPGLLARAERLAAEARKRRQEVARLRRAQTVQPSRVLPTILKPQTGRALAIGFYVNWPASADGSLDSLKRALPRLDWVIPTWLTLEGPGLDFKINL
ncbi:MAG TPA: hypothetical protein VHZ32_15185, partial [Rhizomicrobium sp.]|nr:hypothetical protein [Rhizomicrobium sp.]